MKFIFPIILYFFIIKLITPICLYSQNSTNNEMDLTVAKKNKKNDNSDRGKLLFDIPKILKKKIVSIFFFEADKRNKSNLKKLYQIDSIFSVNQNQYYLTQIRKVNNDGKIILIESTSYNDKWQFLERAFYVNGSIEREEIYSYYKNGALENKRMLLFGKLDKQYHYLYDDIGMMISEEITNLFEKTEGYTLFLYDANKNLTEKTSYTDENLKKMNSKIKYEYSKENVLISTEYYDGRMKLMKEVLNNKEGFIVQIITYGYNKEANKILFRYEDKFKKMIERISFSALGKVDERVKYSINELNGLLTDQTILDKNELMKWQEIYSYNKKGEIISKEVYNSKSKIDHYETFIFNPQGLLLEENVLDREENVLTKKVYMYHFL